MYFIKPIKTNKPMKTAMQELIEHIESNEIVYNKDLILKLKELLEKEKEQIVDACNANLKGLLTTGKDYYDLNFNHHIESEPDTYTNFTPHNANAVGEYNNSLTNFTPHNANAVAEYNNSLTNFIQQKQINQIETPLQNLKHYFRNDETITKRELERAIDELFDNERSFFIEAFNKGVASTGVISIGLNKGLEEYNSLYKTNNL